ncbi:hypothetical protein [Corallincola spongiicola]|uniref:Tetratricopeptide repeat protein n=1 Tax=Corallincola spongiicola TaxID=2520508 RepID=A0ABY1WUQ3_9GAMM|nr:hypothetical protein [Corallincola spongiicola]TAA48407.1 hypothetical protein EXY25_04060 [Corallincola spongiicola]
MITKIGVVLLLTGTSLSSAYASGLWPDHDINDPNLTLNTVASQCQKSLMFAPDQVEAWCEKAYEMGSWESLSVIGLHTGDGSRYVAEAKKHVKAGEANALIDLAWIYSHTGFVERDYPLAINLLNRYLGHADSKNFNQNQLIFAHQELYELYSRIKNKEKASEHLQFLIDNVTDEDHKTVLIRKMEELKQSI